MKYRALVADDEYIIRRGIISFLNRYEDFEVVAEAEDGEMALEAAQTAMADVYFVDITMPFMNGLEFIEELKKIQPKALVVIITGYDRFEYARDAIRLGAFEYLLKPIQEESFDEMIRRLRASLGKKRTEEHYLEWANKKLVENRGRLISDLLQKCINGRLTEDEITNECEYLKMEIPEEYTLVLVSVDYQENEDIKRTWNDDLIFFAVQNIAKEMFAWVEYEISCEDDYGNVVLIVQQNLSGELEDRADRCSQIIKSYLPVKSELVWEDGMGRENLGTAYQNAVRKLESLTGGNGMIQEVRMIIEQNYGREDFSLQDVADEVALSAQYLSKMFRREMGCTFVDYLTNLRIRKSIDLLHNEELKMYEIAEQVGYATQHYFSNVFKKKLGISPNDYRKSIRIRERMTERD